MIVPREPGRRRVLIPQALGADQFLRVTWHEGKRVIVFSHWEGDHCVAATPVRVEAVGELAELVVSALADTVAATDAPASWSPPRPDEVVILAESA